VVGQDGVVEWIGHPASIDEPLEQIVSGNWDRQAAIAEYEQKQRLREVSSEISALARSGDWDAALELVDKLQQETGKSQALTNYRLRLLQSAGRTEEVAKVRAELVDLAWEDAQTLNGIAWNIASAGDAAQGDLELALKAAARASELRNDSDAAILDTLARCHYELGDLDEAIKWQRKAAEKSNGQYEQIDAALQRYLDEQKAESDEESK
jgi:tetratricopeptide (TPR) repeat protein